LSTREVKDSNALYARQPEVSDELKARDLYGELNQNDARDIQDLERRNLLDYDDELVARDLDDNLNLEARDYDELLERYFDDLMERSDDSYSDDHPGSTIADSQPKKPFKKRNFFENIGGWFRKVFHMQTKEDKAYEKALNDEKNAKKAAKKADKEKVHKHVEQAETKVAHASQDAQRQFSSFEPPYKGSGSQSSPSGQDSYPDAANSGSPRGSGAGGAKSYSSLPAEGSNSPPPYGGGYQAREFEDLEERDGFDLDGFDLQGRDYFDDLD